MVFNFLADGRNFTDYQSSCYLDKRIQHSTNISGSEYRLFLQRNASILMDEKRKKAMKEPKFR